MYWIEEENALIYRMLKAGASSAQLSQWFGLTHGEIAELRSKLELPARKGRPKGLTWEEEAALWEHWLKAKKPKGYNFALVTTCELEQRMFALESSEKLKIPMSVVWRAIQGWIASGG
ncbi:MAG: DUF2857 domain-containing protein [Proteobacteria bacterium]|jgi:transposase|nr:DUF2857 domain-containing protein [Pseudomonadota bacterium]MCL2590575.1 DUF2857 domain-containing protein [Betaproteobacteria bacterium]